MTPIKRGDIYYAVWTCTAGLCPVHQAPRRHWASLKTGDRREAKALCAELEKQLLEERVRAKLGLPQTLRQASMSLMEYKDLYLESTAHDKAGSTHKTEMYHLTTLIRHVGAETRLTGLTQDVLENYKRVRLREIAPRSWNSELATLKSVFGWGLRRDPPLYASNPFNGVTRVDKGVPRVEKYIPKADIKAVLRSCNQYWRNVITFLYCTWCRGSELRGLKWQDINDVTVEFKHPKERRRKRIPITPLVRAILQSAKEYAGDSEYVFPSNTGKQMSKDMLHHKLQALGETVGVKLSPHMLRHSGITDALNAGAPLFAVQKQAGHSQVTTTAEYSHMDLESQRNAMDKLEVSELYGEIA